MDAAGTVNFAPMGVEWGEEEIVIKPFLETATFKNLRATRAAVVNLTDDVLLFARAAISSPQFPAEPAAVVRGAVLEAACSWRGPGGGGRRGSPRGARAAAPGPPPPGARPGRAPVSAGARGPPPSGVPARRAARARRSGGGGGGVPSPPPLPEARPAPTLWAEG